MSEIAVFLYLPGESAAVPAGIFHLDTARHIGTFAYGRRYSERPNALAADPISLPLGRNAYPAATLHGGLYGAFRDAEPDHWGRLVYARSRGVYPEEVSEEDFLLMHSATRVGNLDFRETIHSPEPDLAPPLFAELPALLDVAASIERQAPLSDAQRQIIPLLLQGSSLGGARPKSTILREDALWLAKFPAMNDAWNNARVEHAAMTLAGQCGIRVPAMRVETIVDRDILLIERFDRNRLPDGGFARQGYISALTVLGMDELDTPRHSYLALADSIRRHDLGDADQLKELFRRMAFNILVRNTDDHARNHGFLFQDGHWALSPAFDITPARKTPGVGTAFNLAMIVGEHGKLATLDNALSNAERFGYHAREAADVIAELCAIVARWRDVFQECGVSEQDTEMFAPVFEEEGSPLQQWLRQSAPGERNAVALARTVDSPPEQDTPSL